MPIGWQFTVHRPSRPVTPEGWHPDHGNPSGIARLDREVSPLAVWQARVGGLDWIERLVSLGRAVEFAECAGYPFTYLARAEDVVSMLADPPEANDRWLMDEGDRVEPGWGHNAYDAEAVAACAPEEWLLITVWDES